MSKQDRIGVRTAADLERKYGFAGIKKAVRQSEEGINKTNKTLENFVNSTLEQFETVREEIEANATYDVYIESSNGNVFKNGDIESVLTAKVRQGNEDITDQFTDTQFSWTRVSKDSEGDIAWNNAHKHTKTVKITNEDVFSKAIFNVILTLP